MRHRSHRAALVIAALLLLEVSCTRDLEPNEPDDVAGGGMQTLTDTDCETIPREQWRWARCHWTVEIVSYCGGPPPPPDMREQPRCVCNECAEEADCTDGPDGFCRTLSSSTSACGLPTRVCIYEGEPCHPTGPPCEQECQYTEEREPVCAPRAPMPP